MCIWLNYHSIDLTLTTTTHAPHSAVLTKTSEVIHTNQKHPFFTLEKGFVPVAQLHLGMHVLRADGNVGVVTGWKVVPGTKVMYNLEVAQDHTFTVGNGEWVVHNSECGGDVPTNNQGDPYPKMTDPRTGEQVPFPNGDLQQIPRSDRVLWNNVTRGQFISEWYQRGFSEPEGGWANYDIHHILPREYGGTNDFWNLVPLDRNLHQQIVTPWWNAFEP